MLVTSSDEPTIYAHLDKMLERLRQELYILPSMYDTNNSLTIHI